MGLATNGATIGPKCPPKKRVEYQTKQYRDRIEPTRPKDRYEDEADSEEVLRKKRQHDEKPYVKYEDLQNTVARMVKTQGGDEFASRAAIDVLSKRIMNDLPPHRKIASMSLESYNGIGDPYDWITAFEAKMILADFHSTTKCVAMIGCMKEKASTWLRRLPAQSISSYQELRGAFLREFKNATKQYKNADDLFALKQGRSETISTFQDRFIKVYDETRDVNGNTAIYAFRNAILHPGLKQELFVRTPSNVNDLFELARKYAHLESAELSRSDYSSNREPYKRGKSGLSARGSPRGEERKRARSQAAATL